MKYNILISYPLVSQFLFPEEEGSILHHSITIDIPDSVIRIALRLLLWNRKIQTQIFA